MWDRGMKTRWQGSRIVIQGGTKWRMRLAVGIRAQQRNAGRAEGLEGRSRINRVYVAG